MITLKFATVILSLIVTCLGLTAQVRKNHKARSTGGLSLFYFTTLAVSYSCWSAYGLLITDWVLILPMTVGMIMSWIVVAQFFIYKK